VVIYRRGRSRKELSANAVRGGNLSEARGHKESLILGRERSHYARQNRAHQ